MLPDLPEKKVLGWLCTAGLLIPSCIFFRAPSASDGLRAVHRILDFGGIGQALLEPLWWIPALLLAAHALSKRFYDEDLLRKLPWAGRVLLLAAVTALVLIAAPEQRPFIYFQF